MRAYNYPKHANIYTLHASDMQRVHTAMLDACPALAQRVEKAMRVEAAKMACQQSGKQHCYFKGVYAILISCAPTRMWFRSMMLCLHRVNLSHWTTPHGAQTPVLCVVSQAS